MANSKDGKGHKDKYLNTRRKILPQQKLMCNTKVLIYIILSEVLMMTILAEDVRCSNNNCCRGLY